jgi:glyceraldehyde 3-phosphate dehydrogenase
MTNPPAELVDRIRTGKKFVVASHQRPDGDAIGSAMAMALALRAIGKEAIVVTDAIPPVFLQPFPDVESIRITPEINEAFDAASNDKSYRGVLEYSEEQLVSADIVGNPASCIFSAEDTMANGKMVKVLGWYDNEWGFSNRLVDLAAFLGER